MKKILLGLAAVFALSAAPAYAGDAKPSDAKTTGDKPAPKKAKKPDAGDKKPDPPPPPPPT